MFGIHRHLILLDEASDRSDLGDPRDSGQPVFQVPVLNRAQLAEVVAVGLQRVHERPANPGGIRPEGRRHSFREPPGDVVEGFEDSAASPIQIGAVFENNVNERKPEERVTANHLGMRDREHLSSERIRDLIFNDLGRLSGIFGVDDYLDIGKIRDRVERRMQHRIEARGNQEDSAQEYQKLVLDRPLNNSRKHRLFLVLPKNI